MHRMTTPEQLTGCLWGTALGDALGLCREGLSRRRGQRLYPRLEGFQLFGGRGLASDDTEHACFTCWALHQPDAFGPRLRRALRRWLWALPAGVGLATLRAGMKASLGFTRSGVFSAGNGPLMRAPVLAVATGDRLREKLLISTELTHTDPRAYQASLMVAAITGYLLGRWNWEAVPGWFQDQVLGEHLAAIGEHPEIEPVEYAERRGWGRGISGFVYHTAPMVVLAALRYRDDFRRATTSLVECGGDTDTTAAIVGGMVGARVGPAGLPPEWLKAYADWPLTLKAMEELAQGRGSLPSYPLCLGRNLAFGGAVLAYGLRRLLPPY